MTAFTLTDDPVVGPMLEISKPEHGVEIELSDAGRTLWVNVDGVCRLRISRIAVPVIAKLKPKRIRKPRSLSPIIL